MDTREIEEFWAECRKMIPGLPEQAPVAWSFGGTTAQADELLALVLSGAKTATSASRWDYDFAAEPLAEPGQLSIVLDGSGAPQALIETTSVKVVAFNEVTADHARKEGEGDRSLSFWRAEHEAFWRNFSQNPRGFDQRMPVVCEEFRLLYKKAQLAAETDA